MEPESSSPPMANQTTMNQPPSVEDDANEQNATIASPSLDLDTAQADSSPNLASNANLSSVEDDANEQNATIATPSLDLGAAQADSSLNLASNANLDSIDEEKQNKSDDSLMEYLLNRSESPIQDD